MRKKVLVTYSVKYIKEVELEVTEAQNKWLERGIVHNDTSIFEQIYNQNQDDVLFDLPIPTLVESEGRFDLLEVEYIDGSFEIESFEL